MEYIALHYNTIVIVITLCGCYAEHMMVSAQFGQQQENLDVMRSANEVKVAMEKQLERHWEQHQRQIETLKNEVSQREASLEHLQL